MYSNFYKFKSVKRDQDKNAEQFTSRKISFMIARPSSLRMFLKSGSARVFGYTVYRGFLNRVYGIFQLKYGYLVYHVF